MADFPAYDQATRCGATGPGAANLLYWSVKESGLPVRNLGVCNCRTVRGSSTRSCHGECRAGDHGFAMVNGRANPQGTVLLNWFLPRVRALGIQLIIWNRTIWSAKHPNGARYTGVAPHYDHLHIEQTRRSNAALNLATIRHVMGTKPGSIVVPPTPTTPTTPTPLPPRSVTDMELVRVMDGKAEKYFLVCGADREQVTGDEVGQLNMILGPLNRVINLVGAPAAGNAFLRATRDIDVRNGETFTTGLIWGEVDGSKARDKQVMNEVDGNKGRSQNIRDMLRDDVVPRMTTIDAIAAKTGATK